MSSVDADLLALRSTIRALLDEAPCPLSSELSELSEQSLRELQTKVSQVRRRAEALLTSDEAFVHADAEHLLTDGCAEVLGIEAQRLHTKGRILMLLADDDPGAGAEVGELHDRYAVIIAELEAMRELIGALRARLDGAVVEPP